MSLVTVDEISLALIAEAIRAKNGESLSYTPEQMPAAIGRIPTSGTIVAKTITENGTYYPASDNADGYSPVTVNVQGGAEYEAAAEEVSDFLHAEATASFALVSLGWTATAEEQV